MSAKLEVHHLSCACIRGLSIHGRALACHCLLIETPASGLVLVDTGLGSVDYAKPTARLGYGFVYGYARPRRDPSLAAVAQIRALGYRAEDVRHIVLTHMDLDHVGGLSDFPGAEVHLHAAELEAAMARRGFKARNRYMPAMWAHGPRFRPYAETGEPWFGFEAVRQLHGLPEELLLVPLFGHTRGHSGVAVDGGDGDGWMLHAGDAYFDPREVKQPRRQCAPKLALFQALVQTDRRSRLYNQDRLRRLCAEHPEVRVFSAHNPFEYAEARARAESLH